MREELSDWYAQPSQDLLNYFATWRRLSEQIGGASMPFDITVKEIIRRQHRKLNMTEFFYLSTEVGHLIRDASQTMPPHRMVDSDFPSERGYIHFETPMSFSVADDRVPLLVSSITWSRESVGVGTQDVGPGCVTWEYSRTNALLGHPDVAAYPRNLIRTTPLFPVAFGSIRDGRIPWVVWDMETEDAADAVSAIMQDPDVRAGYIRFQSDPDQPEEFVPIPPGSEVIKDGVLDGHWTVRIPSGRLAHYEPDHVGRFLQCFFLFLRQELPSLHREPLDMPKPMLKRFRHKGINDNPITLITWRRRERAEHNTDTGRTISYRFVRRGHWRYNNFRRIDGVRTRWPVFISPVLVGDPSLPFRERTVVNKVSR